MTMQITMLGVTDEVTTCDCCGKRNLKRTVALDREGEVVHFGTDCAAKALRRMFMGRPHKMTPAAILDTARWAMAPAERQRMDGRTADSFKFTMAGA